MKFKILSISILTLAALSISQAHAMGKPAPTKARGANGFCDLTVDRTVLRMENKRVVNSFTSKTLTVSWAKHISGIRQIALNELGPKMSLACIEFIQKQLDADFLHYQCSDPELISSNDDYSASSVVKLTYGTPIYEKISMDQMAAVKCEKLVGCLAAASTEEQIGFVTRMQTQLGCQ